MTDFGKLVPEWVHTLASYKPGKPVRQAELESGVRSIKMASNENPFGPSPLAIEAIKAATAEVNYYPDNGVTELTARLAELHEVAPENILVTAGSTGFLDILTRTLLGPGLNAVTSKLSFISYPIVTRATGARLIEVPALNDGFDLDGILEAIDFHTRVVYIANPNNPTGTILDANAIERFLTSSRYWTKRIPITPAILPPNAASTTRSRSSMCDRGVRSLCCGRSRRHTDWRGCAWVMDWDRRS